MPEVESVSAREPASIHTPTVAVDALDEASVATVKPFGRVEIWVSGDETVVASDRVRRACRCGSGGQGGGAAEERMRRDLHGQYMNSDSSHWLALAGAV